MSSNNGLPQNDISHTEQWCKLQKLCTTSAKYFESHQDENGLRIRAALMLIIDQLEQWQSLYNELSEIAPLYDFETHIPGNGYRSFLALTNRCVIYTESTIRQMCCHRDSVLFRKSFYMREVEACSQLLASLCTCLQHLMTLHSWNKVEKDGKPSLFASEHHSPQELLDRAENINQYCFYGRCLGFQFCDSLRRTLKTIMVFMASFSEVYYSNGTLLGRCSNSVKYVMDPEARARRIVDISQHADISFCKSFWSLNENDIAHILPTMVMPSIAINQVISIPPEALSLTTNNGDQLQIPIPISHIGKKPIHVRLLSAKRRIGMVGSGRVAGELLELSDSLIIHSHGGGFVAQSSKSHEVYLRTWATKLGIPILSIDYSLAPEAPYPRALEEVLYVYAWALNHASNLLGSTARKIIFVGDSAGANLNLGVTLKCIEMNIRCPDGIFMIYSPVLVEFVPSPSRLLCLTDPMLPFGFMMRCLQAYATAETKKNQSQDNEDSKSNTESFAEVSESDLIALALSPNGDESNEEHKLASLPSDSTLNSVSLAEVDGVQGAELHKEEVTSREYIKKFLEMYRNSGLGTSSSPVTNGTIGTDCDLSGNTRNWSLFGWSFGDNNREPRHLDMTSTKKPSEEFAFTVPRDPHLSPYLASDNILEKMPPTMLLTTDVDPCLDDSVMFARKLKHLGNFVTLDILQGLPHGFLNLSLVSKEASEGSDLCITRIQELLDL